jgi:hypothetical protein
MTGNVKMPAADAREQAFRLGQSRWLWVMLAGFAAAVFLWWLGAPPSACIVLATVMGGIAAFLANRTVAPVEYSLKAGVCGRAAASFNLEYREFAAPSAALAAGRFRIFGFPVALPDNMRARFFDEMTTIFGSLGLTPALQAACDCALHYGLLPTYSNRRAADFWSGLIDGGAFEMFQLELSDKRSSPGRYSTGDVTDIRFHGMVMTIATRNEVPFQLVLRASAQGGLLSKDVINGGKAQLGRVAIAGPDAADVFAYAGDPVLAATCLTPAFFAQWQAARATFGDKDVEVTFSGGKAVAVISTKPFFQLTSIDPADDATSQVAIAADLRGLLAGAKILRAMA